jgi:glycosyltransferase involved in cell wall biosynthesis
MESNFDILEYKNNYSEYKNVNSNLIYGKLDKNILPVLTIAIPTYRRVNTLKYAIDSAINQMNHNTAYEIIVVDNDSNENSETEKLILSYQCDRLYYYKNESNLGMFGNINRCTELARGKWIAFLHDDDILKENYIEIMMKLISKKKNVGCIIPSFNYIYDEATVIKEESIGTVQKLKNLIKRNKLIKVSTADSIITNYNIYGAPTCGCIFYREYLLESGGFNNEYYPSSDWLFFIYFGQKYKVYKTLDKLGCYRIFCNTSMKLDIINKFVSDSEKVRCFFSKRSILGRILYQLFANEQHYNSCYYYIKTANEANIKFKIEDFNSIRIYRRNLIKKVIYNNIILNLYNITRLIKMFLWG